jgi:hypothetical protein
MRTPDAVARCAAELVVKSDWSVPMATCPGRPFVTERVRALVLPADGGKRVAAEREMARARREVRETGFSKPSLRREPSARRNHRFGPFVNGQDDLCVVDPSQISGRDR